MNAPKTTAHTEFFNGTPVLVPNEIASKGDGYGISYNNYDVAHFGDVTTAIHIRKTSQFLILNGDHRDSYAEFSSLADCLNYFYANVAQANEYSEHGKLFTCTDEDGAKYIDGGY